MGNQRSEITVRPLRGFKSYRFVVWLNGRFHFIHQKGSSHEETSRYTKIVGFLYLNHYDRHLDLPAFLQTMLTELAQTALQYQTNIPPHSFELM